jgi:hypothetical protein
MTSRPREDACASRSSEEGEERERRRELEAVGVDEGAT